jgi:hypothetical protein
MGAILVIVLLAMLLFGDRVVLPRRKWEARPGRRVPKVVERTPDSESMERYLTAAVMAGVIDKAHYRARMAALAASTEQHADDDVPRTVTDPRLRAAVRLARRGSEAGELVRLLGITHADAVRMIIVARETETSDG